MRGRLAKSEVARRRQRKRGGLGSLAQVAEHAAVTNAGGLPCLLIHRCCRFVGGPLVAALQLLCCCFGRARTAARRTQSPAAQALLGGAKGDGKRGGQLLPVSAQAQQQALAENWERRRLLLRAMLFLLSLICAMCLGAAGI
eukprot:5144109-Prymnesium_polylepis.1